MFADRAGLAGSLASLKSSLRSSTSGIIVPRRRQGDAGEVSRRCDAGNDGLRIEGGWDAR